MKRSEKSENAYLFFTIGIYDGGLEEYGKFIGSPPFVVRARSYQEAAEKIGTEYQEFAGWHKAVIPFDALKPNLDDPENMVEYTAGNFHLVYPRCHSTYGITIFMKEVVAER